MVETARLESVFTLTGNESSNLSLSAIVQNGSSRSLKLFLPFRKANSKTSMSLVRPCGDRGPVFI